VEEKEKQSNFNERLSVYKYKQEKDDGKKGKTRDLMGRNRQNEKGRSHPELTKERCR